MKQFALIFLLIILSECLYGQVEIMEYEGVTTIVKNTQSVNEKDISICRNVIDEINSIQLKCDTIFLRNEFPSHLFTYIYFDENNRLRKYHNKSDVDDGSNEHYDTFAYYDEYGDLVHYSKSGWYHCGSSSYYFYALKGFVVDYYFENNCDCCEKDFVSDDEGIVTNYPSVGDKLELNFEGRSLENFLNVETLQEALKYSTYGEIG